MTVINRVLVVEDNPDSRELLTKFFKFHNIQVVAARSGEEALECLKSFVPNLIMVDLVLPQMDGWTLLKRIREMRSLTQVPTVAITAFHTAELAKQTINAGFNAYFAKPLNVNTLIGELEELLAV